MVVIDFVDPFCQFFLLSRESRIKRSRDQEIKRSRDQEIRRGEQTSEILGDLGGSRSAENHSTLDVLLLDTTNEGTKVVSGLTAVQLLVEHLDTGAGGLFDQREPESEERKRWREGRRGRGRGRGRDLDGLSIGTQTGNVQFITDVEDALLDGTSDDGSTTGDGEGSLDGHDEGFVEGTRRIRESSVDGIAELGDRSLSVSGVILVVEGLVGGSADEGDLDAEESVRWKEKRRTQRIERRRGGET